MKIQVRVGIVGFRGAGIAQLAHFNDMENCCVTAIYDPNDAALTRAKELAPNAIATNNFEEFMLLNTTALAICAPDKDHAKYVVAALNAKKHVICEKPLADSIEGCKKILEAEKSAPGVVAAVQHQMRFLPVHIKMKELIKSGSLGNISYIEGYYVHNLIDRAYKYDNWRKTDNATPLVYSGCHFVDLIRWLLEDEIEEVMGMANNIAFPGYPESDLNVILMRLKSGVIAKIIVAFGAARPQDHSVRIYGSKKSIENNLLFSKDGSFSVFLRPHLPADEYPSNTKKTRFSLRGRGYRKALEDYCRFSVVWMVEILLRLIGKNSFYGVSSYPVRLYPHTLAVRASLENFVKAIQGVEVLQCSLRDAATTAITCLAGVAAYRSGEKIDVNQFLKSIGENSANER